MIRLVHEAINAGASSNDDATVLSITRSRDRLASTAVERSLRSEPLLAKARHAISCANETLRLIRAERENGHARPQ